MRFKNDLDIKGTATHEALRVMREDVFTGVRGDRPTIPNVAVLISDGQSNIDPVQTQIVRIT